MTDEDVQARVLLEYVQTEKTLASKREKARVMAIAMRRAAQWLSNAAEVDLESNGTVLSNAAELDAQIRASLPAMRECLSLDESLKLLDEIAQAKMAFRNVAARKAKLGLG